MAETVTMPKLGFDMAEGVLVRWIIAEGVPVTKGAVLAEIETDKATVEVESTYEGIVYKHLVTQGTSVPVGDPIAIIAAAGEQVSESEPENISSARTVEATKAPSPTPGMVEEAAQPPSKDISPTKETPDERIRVSPLARRIAQEKGVDISAIQGSGPDGRIVKKDIEAYVQERQAIPAEKPVSTPPSIAVSVETIPLAVGEVPADKILSLSKLRAIIGRRMTEAKQQVPHIYLTREFDVAQLMELRSQVNQLLGEGDKVSVNDFVVKAVALALRQFPNLNASLSEGGILQHGHVNIGVAVAVEGGLLTVVCRDADFKPLRQISMETRGMVERARQGKVRPEDIEGSTFSVSNLGMYDISHFVAVINPPEAAILAVGTVKEVPIVENGELKIGRRMNATLSVDHRISDGAEGAKFLQVLAKFLEEPVRILIS